MQVSGLFPILSLPRAHRGSLTFVRTRPILTVLEAVVERIKTIVMRRTLVEVTIFKCACLGTEPVRQAIRLSI